MNIDRLRRLAPSDLDARKALLHQLTRQGDGEEIARWLDHSDHSVLYDIDWTTAEAAAPHVTTPEAAWVCLECMHPSPIGFPNAAQKHALRLAMRLGSYRFNGCGYGYDSRPLIDPQGERGSIDCLSADHNAWRYWDGALRWSLKLQWSPWHALHWVSICVDWTLDHPRTGLAAISTRHLAKLSAHIKLDVERMSRLSIAMRTLWGILDPRRDPSSVGHTAAGLRAISYDPHAALEFQRNALIDVLLDGIPDPERPEQQPHAC